MTDDERAARYHRRQLVLAAAGLILSLGYLIAVLATGVARDLAAMTDGPTSAWWWRVGVVAHVLGAAHALLTLPVSWARGYALPRRYGLLHQSLASWLGDRLKAAALGGALTLAGLEVVYGLLRTTRWWWLVAAAVFFAGQVLMAVVVPVWVMPPFYRLRPLEAGPLRDRLATLADRVGVPVIGVWIADQSRKSRTANAAVVGLGRTRRIILFDTLVAGFPPAEVESVLAHELGHHVHGDMRRGLLAQGLLTLVTFALADAALTLGVRVWDLRGPADPAGVPWLGLVVLVLGLVAMPLGNAFSRWIERQADDFALATTADREAFIGAMERLATLNLAERRPHPVKEFVLYSHPAIDRRIARARTAILALVLALGVPTSASAQASLDSFYPIVARRPVIEHEVELRTTHEGRRGASDTTVSIAVEGPILPRWGVSLAVPIVISDPREAPSAAGIGDVELESKVVLLASRDHRALVTVGLAVALPTGSERRGLGGSTVIEPFVALGLALGDWLTVADVRYAATVAGAQRDARQIGGTWAVGRAFGASLTPFVGVTAWGARKGAGERDGERPLRLESYATAGLNVRLASRVTLGIGVQLPLTRARSFDHALSTTLDWDF